MIDRFDQGNAASDAAGVETERHTYGEWQSLGRQVKRGARRGPDGRFGFDQTKGAGGRRGPRVCAQCGCRINYGMYCGKCEFGR